MSKNPVGWFEIYVNDINRAKKFYETMLAVKLEKLETPEPGLDMWSFPGDKTMSTYGCNGALVKMEGMEAGGHSVIIYFSSEDCAIEEARVQTAGGKVMKPKFSIGNYGYIALAVDTEGNVFGIHSMK